MAGGVDLAKRKCPTSYSIFSIFKLLSSPAKGPVQIRGDSHQREVYGESGNIILLSLPKPLDPNCSTVCVALATLARGEGKDRAGLTISSETYKHIPAARHYFHVPGIVFLACSVGRLKVV